MVVRSFEGRYPDEVAGVVLEDSSSEWQLSGRMAKLGGTWESPEGKLNTTRTASDLKRAGSIDAPLVVLSAGQSPGAPTWLKSLWAKYQKRLARLSPNSLHILATAASHGIHLTQPKLVVAAIRAVVRAVRRHVPLPGCLEGLGAMEAVCLHDDRKLDPSI
jgi:hypothetical protein